MILEVKEYPAELSEEKFYSLMGKYFAERQYRKQMPYLINDKKYVWRLYFHKNELIGFYHYTYLKKDLIEFGGLYLEEKYRGKGLGKRILFEQNQEFSKYNQKSISNNPIVLQIRNELGFVETGKRGSYTILEKRVEEKQ